MLPLLLFPWPCSAPPHFFHSRIATGRLRRSGRGDRFFLNFLCTVKTHDCFNFSCKVLWRIRFADTAFSFSMVKSLFLHLVLLNVCKIFLVIQTEAPRTIELSLLVWLPCNLLVIQYSYWTCGFAIC